MVWLSLSMTPSTLRPTVSTPTTNTLRVMLSSSGGVSPSAAPAVTGNNPKTITNASNSASSFFRVVCILFSSYV